MTTYNNGEKIERKASSEVEINEYHHFNYEKKKVIIVLLKFGTAGLVTYKMQKLTH